MKRLVATIFAIGLVVPPASMQTPQKPPQQVTPEDIIRISTQLVQTDVVVTDKNEQIINDLKLEDFEIQDNGKKQEIKFVEFITTDTPAGDALNRTAKLAPGVDATVVRDLAAKDVRRVMAFVVDDVTIPQEDMTRVRNLLTQFIDNKMQEGDLVAIVRTVGGKGLLEQFTSDRQILRRAIAQLGVRSIPPYLATGGEEQRVAPPSPLADSTAIETIAANNEFEGPSEGTNQIPRAMLALSVSNYLIDSLRQIPGRKSLVLLSGGLPLFDLTRSGSYITDVTQLFRIVTDNAIRSGVVINTMDIRGLPVAGVVAKFQDTPGRSALGGGTFAGGDVSTVGRGYDPKLLGERSLSEELTLRDLAGRTGGVSAVNSNNFSAGLEKILNRSRAYYRLAFRPSEPFDNKFHRVEVKVRRGGVQIYAAEGYYAREEKVASARTKEEEIIRAALSPLARRELDVTTELQYKFLPSNQAQLDINTFIDARKLQFTKSDDGKHHASFEVAGFVFDQSGKNRGGLSQTVNAELSDEEYQRALSNGLSHSASTQAAPGYYQVRLVVREPASGKIGSVARYFEVPDLSHKQLIMSSIMLYQVNAAGADKNPLPLAATRVISRRHDLRYAVVVYNPKLESNKPQAKSQLMISLGGKLLFKEPEQPIQTAGSAPGQFIKVGQLGLSKVNPGRYVLTLVITDPLADKKRQIVSRSVDFTVVE